MKLFKSGIILGCAAVAMLLAPLGAHAVTAAGQSISATSSATYSRTDGVAMPSVSSNTVLVTVGQSSGVTLTSGSATMKVAPGASVSFPLTVTNTGNGSASFNLTTSGIPSGWTVQLFADSNSDGTRQSTETTIANSTGTLAAGATYKFFAEATAPTTVQTGTFTVTAASTSDTTITQSVQLTASVESSQFITTWLINGNYDHSDKPTILTTDYLGGEAYVSPKEGSVTAGKTWTKYLSPTDKVDFIALWGTNTYCAAYAFTYVYSPVTQTAQMEVGSDDGNRVYVNGSIAWDNNVFRGYIADQDVFPINLKQGWNKVLVKSSQGSGGWGFSARVCDSNGNAISGITTALSVPDIDPPAMMNAVVTSLGRDSVAISWATDEPATTVAQNPVSGSNVSDPTLITSHFVTLNNLTPGTPYNVKISSADAVGNTATGTVSFTTMDSIYMTDWIINGPYINTDRTSQLTKDYLSGETTVRPTIGATNGGKVWVSPSIDASLGRVEFHPLYGQLSNAIAYAHTYVYSPTDQSIQLWMGSDDGDKVFVNSTAVYTKDVNRSCTPDDDKIPVTLKKGWNSVLVKVRNGSASWRFVCKFVDSSGTPIPGLSFTSTKPY